MAEGETAGCPLGGGGEAAGVAPGPGWVPGIAPGGLEAAAGWPRFSELIPWTDVGLGVPLAPGKAGAGETAGAGDAAGAGVGAGASIGFAGAGFFDAKSRRVSSIARSIGIRAIPLPLSTQE
ncbi:MAG: hypothetical protein DMF27_02685 [Verrucomicrobia bacterium]|nr:MAG: hypothetical protein DMF27_02685 [Verrucomicrobiota bacterium]PYM09142.1 MAG: hypothetical protein DMF15_06545 [Verrucomicrobiota bacterium]